jgi:hypothetical protein
MTPPLDSSRVPLEDDELVALARVLDAWGVLWAHIPNEATLAAALRRAPKHVAIRYWQRQRAKGVKKGVPDVLVFDAPPKGREFGMCGTAIELKPRKDGKGRGKKPTADQDAWLTELRGRGWFAKVCHGADEAIGWLEELGYGRAK